MNIATKLIWKQSRTEWKNTIKKKVHVSIKITWSESINIPEKKKSDASHSRKKKSCLTFEINSIFNVKIWISSIYSYLAIKSRHSHLDRSRIKDWISCSLSCKILVNLLIWMAALSFSFNMVAFLSNSCLTCLFSDSFFFTCSFKSLDKLFVILSASSLYFCKLKLCSDKSSALSKSKLFFD